MCSVPNCHFRDCSSTFCIWQVSLLISFELLTIPPPTTLLPFRYDRFVTLHHRRSLPCLSPGQTSWVGGTSVAWSRVRILLGCSPTGLAETSSLDYGLVIHLRLLSTLPHGNAVTSFGFRAVTLPWTGLSPDCSNAFTGALAAVAKPQGAYDLANVATTVIFRTVLSDYKCLLQWCRFCWEAHLLLLPSFDKRPCADSVGAIID